MKHVVWWERTSEEAPVQSKQLRLWNNLRGHCCSVFIIDFEQAFAQ